MRAWTNAEIHVYLDRNDQWRARVDVTVHGERMQFDVPPRDQQAFHRAHGLIPLFLKLAEVLECIKGKKVSDDG